MFSLMSLYFAARRNVVVDERHMAGLTPAAQPTMDAPTAAPVSTFVAHSEAAEMLPLARAA